MTKTRVLIADDSAFARKVLREVLSVDPRIEVIGIARDGLEALEMISQLKPHVVTLDLVMPNLDGIGVLKALDSKRPPAVVVVSISDGDSELGIEALESGAVELVHKPTALATSRLYEMSNELVEKVLAAAEAHPPPQAPLVPVPVPVAPPKGKIELVVIGASTGGPAALRAVFGAMPAGFPVPMAVALHIPRGYTEALARRLSALSPVAVEEAKEGSMLQPGSALLAPGGSHLSFVRNGDARPSAHLSATYKRSLYCPSVDALFASAAEAYGPGVLGVVLTGMGNDGLEGARAIRAAGGVVISEAPSTAVIYGMPRCVYEERLSVEEVPLDQMAAAIVRHSSS